VSRADAFPASARVETDASAGFLTLPVFPAHAQRMRVTQVAVKMSLMKPYSFFSLSIKTSFVSTVLSVVEVTFVKKGKNVRTHDKNSYVWIVATKPSDFQPEISTKSGGIFYAFY
jgi:hypothetical protein